MNELGFYVLPGHTDSPRDLIAECRDGERLGLGAGFISGRLQTKEAATICGAVGAVTSEIGIATGVTNHNMRHPRITAGHCTTMHRLTGGRYALGLGRGFDRAWDAFGIPRITTAQMEDFAGIIRRLTHGETIVDHDGPAGRYPLLTLSPDLAEDVPLMLAAFGPNSLALGGRTFDGVILHTFFTDETTARCVDTVRKASEKAGRDPGAVKVWACVATIGDHLSPELRVKKTVGRMATYLQAYGDLMVKTNNWDPAVLQRFRADEFVAGFRGSLDATATTEELEHVSALIPEEWLAPSATGTAEQCAKAVLHQFDLGVDGVILHGATPSELEPILEAYRSIRPDARFAEHDPNPAR